MVLAFGSNWVALRVWLNWIISIASFSNWLIISIFFFSSFSLIHLLNYRPQSVDDEEFYFTDLEDEDDEAICMEPTNVAPPSPPTLSHRDMARPPHEDPEYQRKLVGNMRQGLLTAQTVFKTSLPMSSGCTLLPTNSSYTWSELTPVSFYCNILLMNLISIIT